MDGSDLSPRVRALCDLNVSEVREASGRHEYDGKVQDLSPEGVRRGLATLTAARNSAPRQPDPHDEAHLAAFEDHARVVYGDLELHRGNPLFHLGEIDLACYDRDYGPQEERDAARLAHLAQWPEAADHAIAALDRVSAPVANSLVGAVRGLAAGIPAGTEPALRESALAAHARLTGHIEQAAATGPEETALGGAALASLLGSAEATTVDLGRLAEQADAERDRLRARLAEDCARIDPARPALDVARELVRDHPDGAGVIEAARHWTLRAIEFTRERGLVPYPDGECLVGLAPESRRWAVAMMAWNAPGEPDGPSWFYITPPDNSWAERETAEWLEMFSATTLPGIAVHEVAPGHFSHGRALRQASGEVRRTLMSNAFIEGWAHYAEELCVEEGFGGDDPRFAVGVWLEALVRVSRLACAIGVHTAGMTVDEAACRFEQDTHLAGPAALSEARRATFDPTYGRYTWGKLEILKLRERARKEWGAAFTLHRFHTAMLSLGSPPLGLIATAVDRG
ncbi:MAG TPA: DUF885 family protein [Streptosporangiaceae bacterium]|nr:DUF885 family protein [Streptosporangiaceae bacterium]